MHQVILAGLLEHTRLAAELGISGTVAKVDQETHGRLFDLTVNYEDQSKVNIELKVDANLDLDQMKRQMEHTAQTSERLVYMLLGVTQFVRPAEEIESTRQSLDKKPSKDLVSVVDLARAVEALKSVATGAADPDTRDLAVAYGYFLRKTHEATERFADISMTDWETVHWYAFYNQIRTRLDLGLQMGYVPNPSGGFAGCWWDSVKLDRHMPAPDKFSEDRAYLQLEESKLCFKVSVEDSDYRSDVRTQFSRRVIDAGEMVGLPVEKPQRFGTGDTMTVAVFDGDYRSPMPDGRLSWDHVTDVISKAREVLRLAVDKYRQLSRS
jgi:hypothetical protein